MALLKVDFQTRRLEQVWVDDECVRLSKAQRELEAMLVVYKQRLGSDASQDFIDRTKRDLPQLCNRACESLSFFIKLEIDMTRATRIALGLTQNDGPKAS